MSIPFRKNRFEIICILPFIVFLFIFAFIPVARTVALSFQPLPAEHHACPFTLIHYKNLFAQAAFRQAFFNTIFIATASLVLELFFGLALALLLSTRYRFLRLLRSVFVLPFAIPTVVTGVIMSYLFTGGGWVNRILIDMAIIRTPINWMSGGFRSLIMVTLADCWKVTPLVMLILLAGLESIDRELYRAARIDGASDFYIFKRITLPLLMPSITTAVIIRGIDAFRIFALPLILMGQHLKVVGTYSYLEYMEYGNPYTSAASSTILLVMIMSAVLFYIRSVGERGVGGA